MSCAQLGSCITATHAAQDQKPDCMISTLFRSHFPVTCPSEESPVRERLSDLAVCMPVAIFLLAEELMLRVKELEGF